jgi:methylated-DNA-[protein]-cysteine S-methyltransferase
MMTSTEPEPRQLLRPLAAGQEETARRLHARLAAAAARDGILDVAYRTLDTPVGTLLLAATEAGLVRVAYPRQDHFAGQRRAFEVPVDLRLAHGFRRGVLTHLRQIPYGLTESYAEVALAAGSPRAVRAVGTACARNPVPIVVPCHRVVRSDGSAGGYAGGPEAKQALLAMEAA